MGFLRASLIFLQIAYVLSASDADFCKPTLDSSLKRCGKKDCTEGQCIGADSKGAGIKMMSYTYKAQPKTGIMCLEQRVSMSLPCNIPANFPNDFIKKELCEKSSTNFTTQCSPRVSFAFTFRADVVADATGRGCTVKTSIRKTSCGQTKKPTPPPTSKPTTKALPQAEDRKFSSSVKMSSKLVVCLPVKLTTEYHGCDKNLGSFSRTIRVRRANSATCIDLKLVARVLCNAKICPTKEPICQDGILRKTLYHRIGSVCEPYFDLDIC